MTHLRIVTALLLFTLFAAACQPTVAPPASSTPAGSDTPAPVPTATSVPPTATLRAPAATTAPALTDTPAPTEAPSSVIERDPALEIFANDLRAAIDNRDFEALEGAMGPRFNIIWWMGDGMEYDSDEAVVVLQEDYMTVAGPTKVKPDADVATLLGGRPLAFFAPNWKAESAWLVTGLGQDGKGEGLAFFARQPEGQAFWNGMLFAPAGFDAEGMATYPKWNTYTNDVYGFTFQYPEGWQVVEVPNETYQAAVDQVWLAAGELPPPNTGAGPDVSVTITSEDPSGQWDAQYFDGHRIESTMLGDYPATRIRGVNKESQMPMEVVIAKVGDAFIQVIPNQNPDTAWQYEVILTTFGPASQ